MSENEFFREVNDDYRRDQIARLWTRYSGVLIGLAVLVVAGVGGWRYFEHSQTVRADAAASRFEEAVRLSRDGKGEEGEKALDALAADAPSGYRLLARFRAAAEVGKRDATEGAKAYDALANDGGVESGMRDLARMRAAMLRLDAPDPAPAVTGLQGLAAPGGTWRHTAREMLGLEALKRGDYDGAGRWFDQIAADRETPQGLRQRLEVYVALVAAGPAQVTQ